ncbi:MAG: acyl carrier protein [Nannocystaceae bacterium]|nr:acyl carrier protein [Nannocystaceae bacterium]
MRTLEEELKKLIVEALMLDDVQPDDIQSDAPLFVDGLGLDSVDALELAIAIERRFGVKIEPKTTDAPKIFESVSALATFVRANATQKEDEDGSSASVG